jgi:hypothetical protein
VPATFFDAERAVVCSGGAIVIDPSSRLDRELKAADEFFALSRTATSPFMRAYYQRVGERYLSSQGELRVIVDHHVPARTRRIAELSGLPRDNQGETAASIRMRMCRGWTAVARA